jgi:hypothetical protein
LLHNGKLIVWIWRFETCFTLTFGNWKPPKFTLFFRILISNFAFWRSFASKFFFKVSF